MKTWLITKTERQESPVYVGIEEAESDQIALCLFIAKLGVIAHNNVTVRATEKPGMYILTISGAALYSASDVAVVELTNNTKYLHTLMFVKAQWKVIDENSNS